MTAKGPGILSVALCECLRESRCQVSNKSPQETSNVKHSDRAGGRKSLVWACMSVAFCLVSVGWRCFSDTQCDVGVLLGRRGGV